MISKIVNFSTLIIYFLVNENEVKPSKVIFWDRFEKKTANDNNEL